MVEKVFFCAIAVQKTCADLRLGRATAERPALGCGKLLHELLEGFADGQGTVRVTGRRAVLGVCKQPWSRPNIASSLADVPMPERVAGLQVHNKMLSAK